MRSSRPVMRIVSEFRWTSTILALNKLRYWSTLPGFGCQTPDLDHGQFVTDKGGIIKVYDLDDVDEFCQLIDGLIEFPSIFDGNDDIDAGHIGFFRVPGVNAFDIDGSAADEAGNMGQTPGLLSQRMAKCCLIEEHLLSILDR